MHTSPLRYPGGKGKLASYIKSLLQLNNLCDGHYSEPYAGGSAVAFELLFLEYVSHVHINDIDPAVYSFWDAVLTETDNLCRLISSTRVSMAGWHRQKTVLETPNDYSTLEFAFATFFVNRTARSGILNGGVIGGLHQRGRWKLDARYNKKELISRIEKIARYRDRISLYNQDALLFIRNIFPKLPPETLVYLDPPYYVTGKGLYRSFYAHHDHEMIEKELRQVKRVKWLVTYDNVPEIRNIYRRYAQRPYSLTYTAQTKTINGREIIIYGPTTKFDRNVIPFMPKSKRLRSNRMAV